jgi:hypothetical protein
MTNFNRSSRTECYNDECYRITNTCRDGDCTETRVVIDNDEVQQTMQVGNDSNSDSDSDSDSDSESENENNCIYDEKTFTVLINDIDITIPSFIVSIILFIFVIYGYIRIKK